METAQTIIIRRADVHSARLLYSRVYNARTTISGRYMVSSTGDPEGSCAAHVAEPQPHATTRSLCQQPAAGAHRSRVAHPSLLGHVRWLAAGGRRHLGQLRAQRLEAGVRLRRRHPLHIMRALSALVVAHLRAIQSQPHIRTRRQTSPQGLNSMALGLPCWPHRTQRETHVHA